MNRKGGAGKFILLFSFFVLEKTSFWARLVCFLLSARGGLMNLGVKDGL